MALNNFTDEEAIEICIALRDKIVRQNVERDYDLKRAWYEADALAIVINLATKVKKGEKQK